MMMMMMMVWGQQHRVISLSPPETYKLRYELTWTWYMSQSCSFQRHAAGGAAASSAPTPGFSATDGAVSLRRLPA